MSTHSISKLGGCWRVRVVLVLCAACLPPCWGMIRSLRLRHGAKTVTMRAPYALRSSISSKTAFLVFKPCLSSVVTVKQNDRKFFVSVRQPWFPSAFTAVVNRRHYVANQPFRDLFIRTRTLEVHTHHFMPNYVCQRIRSALPRNLTSLPKGLPIWSRSTFC